MTRCALSDSIGMDTCQKEGWRWQAFRLRTLKKWIIRISLGGVAIGNCSDVSVGGPPNGCGRLGLSGKCGERVCGVSRDFPML